MIYIYVFVHIFYWTDTNFRLHLHSEPSESKSFIKTGCYPTPYKIRHTFYDFVLLILSTAVTWSRARENCHWRWLNVPYGAAFVKNHAKNDSSKFQPYPKDGRPTCLYQGVGLPLHGLHSFAKKHMCHFRFAAINQWSEIESLRICRNTKDALH